MRQAATMFLLLSPLLSNAQQPAVPSAPRPVEGKPAQLAQQDAAITQAALKAARMVDAGQTGALWDGASIVAKKAVARDAFIRQVSVEQVRLGTLVARGAASVTRVNYAAGAPVPQGLYVNVSFASRFSKLTQPVRELVSFRLDEDRVWRLSGYHLRTPE
jgi:hypothetical protein